MRKSPLIVLISFLPFLWTGCNTTQSSAPAPSPAPQMVSAPPVDQRQVEMANLRNDLRLLERRVGEMQGEMEALTFQNRQLTEQLERQRLQQANQMGDVVRQSQLNQAINDFQQRSQTANTEMRRQIIRDVTQQIEQLGQQMQAAIDTVARAANRPATPAATAQNRQTFSNDFPQTGIPYIVQQGDTLSGIAARHRSTVTDIQNANQISDPRTIRVGQTLFIPQRNN